MSLAYRLLYRVGFTPWEQMATHPITAQIGVLFDREQAERGDPPGRALDLGCGSGAWAVDLAARGWRVTGVDFVPRALERAAAHARDAGVEVKLVQADVTRLGSSDAGDDFDFVLDFGVFHDELSDSQREAMGREVTAVAAAGATMLMLAWSPGRRGPLPRGASRKQIEAAYPTWEVIDEEPFDIDGAPRYMRKAAPRFYRLRLT